MKTLYIVRHAKSSWEYEGIKDIDRPLNKRGINSAYLISSVLNKKVPCPDVFISSCANRALHTAMIFSYTPKANYTVANEAEVSTAPKVEFNTGSAPKLSAPAAPAPVKP